MECCGLADYSTKMDGCLPWETKCPPEQRQTLLSQWCDRSCTRAPCLSEVPQRSGSPEDGAGAKAHQVLCCFAGELTVAESMPCTMKAFCNLKELPFADFLVSSAVGPISIYGRGDLCIFFSLFHQNGSCALGQKPSSNSRLSGCFAKQYCAILRNFGSW